MIIQPDKINKQMILRLRTVITLMMMTQNMKSLVTSEETSTSNYSSSLSGDSRFSVSVGEDLTLSQSHPTCCSQIQFK